MNILVFNYEYPPIGGGGGKSSWSLNQEFSRFHKIMVITSHYKGLPIFSSEGNELIIRIPVFRKLSSSSRLIEMFLFNLLGIPISIVLSLVSKPDAILSHFILPTSVIPFILKKLFRIKYFVVAHGGDVPSHQPNETKFLYKIFLNVAKLIVKNAEKTIFISKDLYKKGCNDFFQYEDNLLFIPNGIKILKSKNFNFAEKEDFVFLGRLSKEKRVNEIIYAFMNAIKKTNSSAKLHIIGDGEEKVKMQYLQNDRIIFHGWKNELEITNIFAHCKFMIINSMVEGLSISALEALSNGIPILSSDCEGMLDLVKDNETGFLHSDRFELEKNIIKATLIDKNLYKELVQNSYNFVKMNYDIKLIAKRYLALFRGEDEER